MKGINPLQSCVLSLALVLPASLLAADDGGFLDGLGSAFSDMGRNFKDVVTGRSEGPMVEPSKGDTGANGWSARQRLVFETQYRLNALGYPSGTADGLMGQKTAAAIRRYQQDTGLPVDGRATPRLLASLQLASRTLKIPGQPAAAVASDAASSSSIGEAFGNVLGEVTRAFSAGDAQNAGTASNLAGLAGQLDASRTGRMPGQSNDGIALALGALAATAAGNGTSGSPDLARGSVPAPGGSMPGLPSSQQMIAGMARNTLAPTPGPGVTRYDGAAQATSREETIARLRTAARSQVTGTTIPENCGTYLDCMVAQQDRMVYEKAADIDPHDRMMAERAGVDVERLVAKQLAHYEQNKRDAAEIERRFGGGTMGGVPTMSPPHAVNNVPVQPGERSASPHLKTAELLAGGWEGRITVMPQRIGIDPTRSQHESFLQLDIDPASGLMTTTYPLMGCSGVLIATAEDGKYRETLVTPGGQCLDGGRVGMLYAAPRRPVSARDPQQPDQIFWYWRHPVTGDNAMGGQLHRVSAFPNASRLANARQLSRVTE